MRTPGFNAERALYTTRGRYRSRGGGDRSGVPSVSLQQRNEGSDGGTCCGKHCPGLCVCNNGVGSCLNVTQEATPSRLLMAGDVRMASSSCHAEQAHLLPDGISWGVSFVVCPGPCYATTHDAGCLHHM